MSQSRAGGRSLHAQGGLQSVLAAPDALLRGGLMKRNYSIHGACAALSVLLSSASAGAVGAGIAADAISAADSTGTVRTFTESGSIETSNPFFQSLGSN